jgi:O-antigen/teichoic acid export membrane protein
VGVNNNNNSDTYIDYMQTEKRIFTNTLSLSIGKISADIATFFFLVYFARAFGASYFGQYAFAMSLGGFLSIIVTLGLNSYIIREISKDKSQNSKYMSNVLVTQCVLASISWGLIFLIAYLSSFDDDSKLIILMIGAYQVLYQFTQLIHAQFKAHEDMKFNAFLEIYHKVVILIFGSLSIIIWHDPVLTLLIYPISAFSMLLIGINIAVRRYGRPEFDIDLQFIKELFYKALPFMSILILTTFYDRTGVIVLTALKSDIATGVYAASDRLIVTFVTAIGMFGAALFPVMSRFAKFQPEKLMMTCQRSMRILVVTILPVSTCIFLISDEIIEILYGSGYAKSSDVLKVLCWAILPSGLNVILTSLLIATNQQNIIVRIQLIIVLAFITTCFILIPEYSYIGLAYAKMGASVTLFLAYSVYIMFTYRYDPIFRNIIAPSVSCLASIFIFNVMIDSGVIIAIFTAGFACIVLLLLTGSIRFQDMVYVRNILVGVKQ